MKVSYHSLTYRVLTISIKACSVNVVVNIKPNYLNNFNGKLCFIAKKIFIEKEIQRRLSCKKIYFPMTYIFIEYGKIVKIYMVNFNVTIFNRPKIMGFL